MCDRTFFVMLMAAACLVAAQDNFYFSVHPKSHSVLVEHTTVLECDVSDRRNVVFSWTLNGLPFANTSRRFQRGSNLHIRQVDREADFGEFRCNAMNKSTGFSLDSSAAVLNVLWVDSTASVILQSPESKDLVRAGTDLVLRCVAEGNPDLQHEWYLNGIRLFRNDRIALKGKRLELANVSAADNGIYACRAENEAGAVDSSDNFALTLYDSGMPHIVRLPQDVTVRRSDSVYFDCVYENADRVEWYSWNDGPLTNSSRLALFANGSLHIHRVKSSDEGQYRCVGTRRNSSSASSASRDHAQTYVVELKIATIDSAEKDAVVPSSVAAGLNLVPSDSLFGVMCRRPKGFPRPRIWWEDPKGKVISDVGRIRVDDAELVIAEAQTADSGNYTCVAENMAGARRTRVQVYVAKPPLIVRNPASQTVDEGSNARFSCSYSGAPHPLTTVGWRHADRVIRNDSFSASVFSHNGTLLLYGVQMMDAGEYVCEVNTVGFSAVMSAPATLEVREKLKFFPIPVNRKLELGSQSKIYCKARGSVIPVVHWSKEGQLISEWPSHIREDENGTLHFDTVTTEDAGRYTCGARSAQGYINATIQVDVIVTAKFVVQPANTDAVEGYSAIVHCKAYGDPPPNIQWDKNSILNNFDPARFQVMENGSLFISKVYVSDQGKYGCTVGNSGGFKREEMSLTVRGVEELLPGDSYVDSTEEKKEDNVTTKTLVITLGAATAYMVLVVGLMVWCRYRRARQKAFYLRQAAAEGTQLNKAENGDVNHEDGAAGGAAGGEELQTREPREYKDNVKSDGEAQSQASTHSRKSRASYDKLQFPRHDLQTIMLLGKGNFGEVFLAKAQGIRDGEAETIVMVKTLHSRDESAHFAFRRELEMYHKLNHDNVARLMGICKEAEPYFMIMEYSDWGDLKQYLLATRKDNPRKSPRPPKLSTSQVVSICNQVALGMEFLSNSRFVHKDLAARNCLVTSSLDVKISNPSLSKDTYSREYCRYHGKQLPVRWMPPEAIFEDEFSTKSDVWSFAVLVWEVFAQGDLPFADMSDDTFLKSVKAKELEWALPQHCPTQMRALLNRCWMDSPKDRPTFSDVVLLIADIQVDSDV